ncbi:13464_t:CDS:2, partial [Funneliformis geosporum]
LSDNQPIHFMPTEVSDDTKYTKDIKPFFDIVVPEEISLFMFKIKLVNILSNTLKDTLKFGIKHISAFSL